MARKTKPKNPTGGISYEQAGVSIDSGDELVERLAKSNKAIGGFSGAFPLKLGGIKKPVLVASTDGVGTKLLLARRLKKYDTIGIDLVAMVVNDLLVCGARPLFFLDYYATGKLSVDQAETVLQGISRGCEEAGIPLIGGETAEMPGMYQPGDFDLAGFGVGLTDKSDLMDGSRVKPGDVVIGIASSGVHSNGYSLVRAVIRKRRLALGRPLQRLGGATLGDALLAPTKIYSRAVAAILKAVKPTAMAHITGGGLPGNLVRVLPKGMQAVVDPRRWAAPPIFDYLREHGRLDEGEMRRVFNMGIGFCVVCRPKRADKCLRAIEGADERAWVIGEIREGKAGVTHRNLRREE